MRRNVDRELLEKSRYTQVSRSQFLDIVLRRVKARDDDSDDDDSSDDDEMRNDTEIAKKEILGIRNEGDKIFTRIWVQNELKITLTQIREYMRHITSDFNDSDALSFIKQRLERYIKKNNIRDTKNNKFSKKNIQPLTIELFKKIMTVDKSEYLKYNQQQQLQKQQNQQKQGFDGIVIKKFALFDEDDVPEVSNLNQVLKELKKVYSFSENQDRLELSVLDAHNLIWIAKLMQDRIQNEIKSRGHDLELTQELFIKTMEKKVYFSQAKTNEETGLDYDYSKPFEEWSEVARHSASVFQQVHDEEQNKVTLGQVRETLRWIYNDIKVLMPISKFKKKLQRKKKLDQMVDHARFWKFLVTELGVEDDSRIAIMRLEKDKQQQQQQQNNHHNMLESKYNEDSSSSSSDEGLQRIETQEFDDNNGHNNTNNNKRKKSKIKKKTDDFKKRKLTNYERSNRVFDLMENQNGLWICMRQIHVYLKWLTEKLQSLDIDWTEYINNHERIDEIKFKTEILKAAHKNTDTKLRQSVIDIGTKREELMSNVINEIDLGAIPNIEEDDDDDNAYMMFSGGDNGDIDDEKYATKNEALISELELNRLKKMWKGDDMKLFSKQLSWIFTRCALIDIADDDRASWYHICKFTQGFRDGTIEERIRHDLKFLTGNHQVYRDEFEQFKATLKCRGDAAISLFYQIRHFCESITWSQIAEFLEFIEINMINVEDAIDEEPMGEDEDPTVEELIPLMKIPSEVDGNWLFSIVIQRHSAKVSWVEIREYLIDWNETRDEVTEYFEELIEKRDRVKLTEKTLDDITNKLNKIKLYFDQNTNISKDELIKKTKDELIEYIVKSSWYFAAKQGFVNNNIEQQSIISPSADINKQEKQHSMSISLNDPSQRNYINNNSMHKPRHSGKILGSIFSSKN